ncbi:hypothetical protein Patl1_25618 [Pistacia atlantica]|uniref:Uncharacterized protein n=1 Tax=Pistacia atlantica TaxID=434234 RepID=A0ACC1B3J8_9ROSI|nr:hypothetical protein Patl1_25618 [Pistacia atlantica]
MTPTKILINLLNNPTRITSKSQAKQLHAQIFKTIDPNSPSHVSKLLSIYTNLNLLHGSLDLFNTLHSPPPPLAWKSIIRCYTDNGLFVRSLLYFVKMMDSGVYPDHNVFPSVLKSCTLLVDFRFGESVHACIIRLGVDFDLYTNNALMNMYAKFQSLGLGVSSGGKFYEHKVLDKMPQGNGNRELSRGLVSCTEFNCRTVDLRHKFEKQVVNVGPNVSLDGIGDDLSSNYGSGQVDDHSCGRMYNEIKPLQMDSVRKVFETMPIRDLVSWNTMIVGLARNGLHEESLKMVREMGNSNLKPDSFTLSSVLPVFAEYVDVVKGKEIHGYSIRHGLDTDVYIGSSLIDMMCAEWFF